MWPVTEGLIESVSAKVRRERVTFFVTFYRLRPGLCIGHAIGFAVLKLCRGMNVFQPFGQIGKQFA